MTSEGGDFKLSKFNGGNNENFQLWSVRYKAALKSKNVWSVVRPEVDATSSWTATGGEATEGVEAGAGNQTVNQALKADKAVGIIVASLGDKPLQAVFVLSVQDDPREMWKRLQARYSNKSENAKVMVYDKIAAVSLKADGNVRSLISDLEVLYDQLLSMGDEVSESQRVAKLLGAVRDEYESVVTALRTVSEKLTWDSVAARLQDEYDCRVSSSPKNKKKALNAQEVKLRKDRPKCYGCGKVGHKIRDCNTKENDTSGTESEKVERRRAKSSSAKKAVDRKDKKKDRTLSVERTAATQSREMYDRDEAADEFLIAM
jgi:gag-polypeptide of LTR copia-type